MDKLLLSIGGGLLADQTDVLRNLARGFPANPAAPDTHRILTSIALILGFLVLIWLLSRLAKRQEKPGSYNSPRLLFKSLCEAHQLDRHQRQLLARLAKSRRIEHPAALFLDPNLLDPEDLAPSLREHAGRLRMLRERLFVRPIDAFETDRQAPLETAQSSVAGIQAGEAIAEPQKV
jgi:hypothetical protein